MNSEIANGQPSQSGKKSSISSNKEKQPEHISLTNERSPELLNEVIFVWLDFFAVDNITSIPSAVFTVIINSKKKSALGMLDYKKIL